MPAGILIRAWWRQVVTGSLQASTVYVHRPGAPGVTVAPHRSEPGVSSRIGVQGPGRPSGS